MIKFAYKFLYHACAILLLLTFAFAGISLITFFKGRHTEAIVSGILAVGSVALFLLSFCSLRLLTNRSAKSRAAASSMAQKIVAAKSLLSEIPGSRMLTPNIVQFGSGSEQSGAHQIVQFLMDAYHDTQGISAETVLSAAGALAGFAAQEAIWEGVVRTGKMGAAQALIRVNTKSGETYYFGDFLNTILASTKEGQLSIWRLVGIAATEVGAQSLPPLEPLFAQCAETVGTSDFGKPKLPSNLVLRELPRQALRHWQSVKTILVTAGVQPLHWPLELGVAAQKLIFQTRAAIPADVGALVVMQAAISMSRVDPKTVPGGTMVE